MAMPTTTLRSPVWMILPLVTVTLLARLSSSIRPDTTRKG